MARPLKGIRGGGKTAPAPVILGVTDGTTVDADGQTSDPTPVLYGTAAPGEVVYLFVDGVSTGLSTTAAADGTWQIELPDAQALEPGSYVFTARTIEGPLWKGRWTTSDPYVLEIVADTAPDNRAPDAPSVPDLVAASDTGLSDSDNLTSSASLTLGGTAEAGATVELWRGATLLGSTTADAAGAYSLTITALPEGGHTISAVAIDPAGNRSAPSGTLSLRVDRSTPEPVVDGVLMSDGTAAGGVTDDSTPAIRGTAEAHASVEVLIDGSRIGTTRADDSGAWTLIVAAALADGSHSITVEATDLAGNSRSSSGSYAFAVETDPQPPAPVARFVPTDDRYAQQWNLDRLDAHGDGERAIERIWADYTGAGVSVGAYDDGIEHTHVEFSRNYVHHPDLPDPYPLAADEGVHGTAVAGVLAADANGVGTVGVAWGASLTGVRLPDVWGSLTPEELAAADLASAAQWQFDVVSHSWGSEPTLMNGDSRLTAEVLADWNFAVTNGRGGLGTIIVMGAGNAADNAAGDYLNTVRHSITVTAFDSDDDSAWYANRGANLLVSAPSSGKRVLADDDFTLTEWSDLQLATVDRAGANGYAVGAWTSSLDKTGFGGTSATTPQVSGVVALMLEANPDLGWRDVQTILAYSARHVGGTIGEWNPATETIRRVAVDPYATDQEELITLPVEYFKWDYNGAGNWNGGGLHYSGDYGYGGVDVYSAVRMAEVWSEFGPAETSANEISVSTAAMNPRLSVSGAGATQSRQYEMSGLSMELEYVDVSIVVTAALLQEVELYLTSPSGTTVALMSPLINTYAAAHGPGATLSWDFGVNGLRGEDPNGTWIITLREGDVSYDIENYGRELDGISLDGVQFTLHGSAVSSDDVYHYTAEMLTLGLAGDADRVALSDAGGTDWLDFAATDGAIVVDLAPGGTSTLDGQTIVVLSPDTMIENAVGGDGDDRLTGNDAGNRLSGMRGNDLLDGRAGDDRISGGRGDDTLTGGAGLDLFEFEPGDGHDRITDFEGGAGAGDVVWVGGWGFSSFAELAPLIGADALGNIRIDFDSANSLTFAGVTDLQGDDFLFSASAA